MSYPYRNPFPSSSGYPNPTFQASSNPLQNMPYPSQNNPYPSQNTPYPPQNTPYPPQNSPYPPQNTPYPPQNSPYPPQNSPYPPQNTPYPPQNHPFLQQNNQYSPQNTPYPSQNSASQNTTPYPNTMSFPDSVPSVGFNSSLPNRYPVEPSHSSLMFGQSNTSSYPIHDSRKYPTTQANPAMQFNVNPSMGSHLKSTQNQTFKPYPASNQFSHKMAHYEGQGTVAPYPSFDPNQDAQALRKAMKGFGTDEKAIIDILARRSNSQRVYIGVAFKQLFGKDLIDDLKSELSGRFEDVIVALMTPLNDYLAMEAHRALSGFGTDEDTLIEILCTRTNHEIWGINESYRRLYGKSLEEAISGDTSGYFKRLLVSCCTGARSESQANPEQARQDAQQLYAAGVGQWGTDESAFNAILMSRSFHHLSLTFYEYQKITGHTVVDAIKSEMSGDLKNGMLAVARSVENRPSFFAEKLYTAMKGLGTTDQALIRVVTSRCEIDMVQIKAEYERNYGKPLVDAIKDDTSGDYKRVLVALVSG